MEHVMKLLTLAGCEILVYPVIKLVHSVVLRPTETRKNSSHFSAEPNTSELEVLHFRNAHIPGITCHIPIKINIGECRLPGMLILGKTGRVIFSTDIETAMEAYNSEAMALNREWIENLTKKVSEAKTMSQKGKAATEKIKTLPIHQGVVEISPHEVWMNIHTKCKGDKKIMEAMLYPTKPKPKGDLDM